MSLCSLSRHILIFHIIFVDVFEIWKLENCWWCKRKVFIWSVCIDCFWGLKLFLAFNSLHTQFCRITVFIRGWEILFEKLGTSRPLIRIYFQAFTNDFLAFQAHATRKSNSIPKNRFINLLHIHSFIKSPASQTFEQNNSKSPNLRLLIINIIGKRFRRHIRRWTHIILERGFPITGNLTIAKINNFGLLVMQHDVGRFEVSMDNLMVD